MKTINVLFLFIFIAFKVEAQTLMKIYENDYIQFEYPENWDLKENDLAILIDIPDSSFINSNIQIRVSKTNLISPPIIEAMMSDMQILEYGERTDPVITNIKSTTTKINGIEVCKIDRSNKEKVDLQYIWTFESKLTVAKIRSKVGIGNFSIFEQAINQIIESVQFKDFHVDETDMTVIEATEQEFTKEWIEQKAQMAGGSSNNEIPKLDSLLFYLKSPYHSFRIIDTDIEIRNWADFFNWKPHTALKDYEVFAFQNWAGEFFQVFRMYMHLGEYDNLRIRNASDKQLGFLFSKENGHSITWILEYEGPHEFPVNENIKLDRFLYTTTNLYSRKSDGKIAYDVAFLINDKVYRIKVENLAVY